jgi:multidrug efflux system outer membrane protein
MAALLLSACMVGPDYRRPEIDVPPAWRSATTRPPNLQHRLVGPVRGSVLSSLVRAALANNKDLQIATANVDQAVAQYGIVRSAQFPEVNAGASATRSA